MIDKVHQVYQFHQNGLASPYDGHLKSPDGLIDIILSMLDEMTSNIAHKDEEDD